VKHVETSHEVAIPRLRSPLALAYPRPITAIRPSDSRGTRSLTVFDRNFSTSRRCTPAWLPSRSRSLTQVGQCSFYYPQITPLLTAQASRAYGIHLQGFPSDCRACMEQLSKVIAKWTPLLRDMHVRICYWARREGNSR
jgi:hypothetical protein